MKDARQTFEAIARANGGTDFLLKQDGRYAVQNIQSRWTYFRLGWEAATKREQPAQQQEPVAWGNFKEDGTLVGLSQHPEDQANWTGRKPLYTSPPAQRTWVGLTDEEIDKIPCELYAPDQGGMTMEEGLQVYARAIEAKLKEKNT